jgi:hypothetical protein
MDHDGDFWPNMEEADAMLEASQSYLKEQRRQLDQADHLDEQLSEISVVCAECRLFFKVREALKAITGRLVELRCPKCSALLKSFEA